MVSDEILKEMIQWVKLSGKYSEIPARWGTQSGSAVYNIVKSAAQSGNGAAENALKYAARRAATAEGAALAERSVIRRVGMRAAAWGARRLGISLGAAVILGGTILTVASVALTAYTVYEVYNAFTAPPAAKPAVTATGEELQRLEKPFDKPMYLMHENGQGTLHGPEKRDGWVLFSSDLYQSGYSAEKKTMTVPDIESTVTYSVDSVSGPYSSLKEICPSCQGKCAQDLGMQSCYGK